MKLRFICAQSDPCHFGINVKIIFVQLCLCIILNIILRQLNSLNYIANLHQHHY